MKRVLSIIVIFSFIFSSLLGQECVRIHGQVTDFNGNPIDSVSIRLKNKAFTNLYETLSDKDGKFSMVVKKGNYYCLYAIKLSDYKKTKLEYWAWNVPVYKDLEINPQYNNMEIYGINAFEMQVTPQESYRIYFRPMSLKKAGHNPIKVGDTVNIAPEAISPEELSVLVNGIKAKIVTINKVTEYARGIYLYGYEVQIIKPSNTPAIIKETERIAGFDKITIVLDAKETGEIGKGEAFISLIE
ncbi:MAG: carboxypeptidase-like regulatory domain-containing protein [Rikenellaceae bacterium]|nr:carboxypeptidase-like regulatory domain-containing protein [Rikenellaceae bacterium]